MAKSSFDAFFNQMESDWRKQECLRLKAIVKRSPEHISKSRREKDRIIRNLLIQSQINFRNRLELAHDDCLCTHPGISVASVEQLLDTVPVSLFDDIGDLDVNDFVIQGELLGTLLEGEVVVTALKEKGVDAAAEGEAGLLQRA